MSRSIVLVLLAGCGRLNFEPFEGPPAPDDGSPSDTTPACTMFGPWGNVQRLAALATPAFELAPAIHPSGLVLVYDTVVDSNRDLMIAKRGSLDALFESPVAIVPLTTADDDMQAAWSPDGKRLHFHRLGTGDQRMVADYLGEDLFDIAVPDPTFPAGDNPSFSSDGKELFYTTYTSNADVAHARFDGSTWVPDNEVAALNTPLAQGYPAFDSTTQTLYFERDSDSGTEIAFATRTGPFQPFDAATVVPELMLVTGKNGDPDISADGRQMVFSSERAGSDGIDLYLATRSCL